MNKRPFRTRQCRSGRGVRGWLLAALAALACMAGCAAPPSSTPVPSITPTAARPQQPTAAPTVAPRPTDGITLTWWTPEFLSPGTAQPAGALLAQQLADFEAAQGGRVRVVSVPKASYGKGGLLDFLRTAAEVAPGVLPDVVALDLFELEHAAAASVLQPLGSLLDEGTIGMLYPFARPSVQFGDRLLAVPYLADLTHLAYRPNQVETPPSTWAELLDAGNPYLFPVAIPQAGSTARTAELLQNAVLSHYLSAGAKIDPDGHLLTLAEEPLSRLLSFYEAGAEVGLIPPGVLELADIDAVWNVYAQGQVPLACVSARRYLAEREDLADSGFAATPGWSGPATPLAEGWALAIVASDPRRQRAAADLIAWLLQPDRAGPAAAALGWLPASPDALATWGIDPYYEFLDAQLAVASPPPAGADYPQTAARLQKAVEAVLRGEVGAAEAARSAVAMPK